MEEFNYHGTQGWRTFDVDSYCERNEPSFTQEFGYKDEEDELRGLDFDDI